MTWDVTKPAGTRALSLGDDDIRELKTDLQNALRANDATLGNAGVMPGAAAATPLYHYRGLKGTTAQKPAATNYGLYFNTDTNEVERDNGTSWEQVAVNFDSGTDMVFYQGSAPTGWTINSSINDRMLLIDSAAGGTTGGSWTLASESSHTHNVGRHQEGGAAVTARFYAGTFDGSNYTDVGASDTNKAASGSGVRSGAVQETGTIASGTAFVSSAGSSHTHTHGSTQHNWAKVIVCSKD